MEPLITVLLFSRGKENNINLEKSPCLRIENKMSRYTKIEREWCKTRMCHFCWINSISEREMGPISGSIIGGGANLNSVSLMVDGDVLLAKTKEKIHDFLDKADKRSGKKGLSIVCRHNI